MSPALPGTSDWIRDLDAHCHLPSLTLSHCSSVPSVAATEALMEGYVGVIQTEMAEKRLGKAF